MHPRGDHRTPLPVSLRGAWSPRQAFHVMESMRDQAEAQGLMLVPVNVTTFDTSPRLLVLVMCRAHHDEVVPPGTICEECQREWPR